MLDVELWEDDQDGQGGADGPDGEGGGPVLRATIDTVAVHPDHARRGMGRALLEEALRRLPGRAVSLDAWTRDDVAANDWYRAHGFTEQTAYLHVHKAATDPHDGFTTPAGLSAPVTAFCHARMEHEGEMRSRFARVHVCRQYLRPLRSRT